MLIDLIVLLRCCLGGMGETERRYNAKSDIILHPTFDFFVFNIGAKT